MSKKETEIDKLIAPGVALFKEQTRPENLKPIPHGEQLFNQPVYVLPLSAEEQEMYTEDPNQFWLSVIAARIRNVHGKKLCRSAAKRQEFVEKMKPLAGTTVQQGIVAMEILMAFDEVSGMEAVKMIREFDMQEEEKEQMIAELDLDPHQDEQDDKEDRRPQHTTPSVEDALGN